MRFPPLLGLISHSELKSVNKTPRQSRRRVTGHKSPGLCRRRKESLFSYRMCHVIQNGPEPETAAIIWAKYRATTIEQSNAFEDNVWSTRCSFTSHSAAGHRCWFTATLLAALGSDQSRVAFIPQNGPASRTETTSSAGLGPAVLVTPESAAAFTLTQTNSTRVRSWSGPISRCPPPMNDATVTNKWRR